MSTASSRPDAAFVPLPRDRHNQKLIEAVRPSHHQNPVARDTYDLVVIGGGTAGLVGAGAATIMGARVALIERHLLGGDCLNYGCVPSKALIRAGQAAWEVRNAARFGIEADGIRVDFARAMQWVREVRANISTHDSVQRFSDLGIDVYLGDARFSSKRTLRVDDRTLDFRRALIATGARATMLPIPGLAESKPLTNETIFSLTKRPERLAVLGGGPIGCELAQAMARLGCEVTILETAPQILGREDSDAVAIVGKSLEADGIQILCEARTTRVESVGDNRLIHYELNGVAHTLEADQILVGVGRAPNVDNLDLEQAGVDYDSRNGITVSDYLRTSNRRIYAAGDVCLALKFTHSADASARIAVENALFFGFRKLSALSIPRSTYTSPEIATIGLTESEAEARGIHIDTWERDLAEVDRAICNGATSGFLKIRTRRGSGKIVGATLVAPNAGDLISELSVAMQNGITLKQLATVIHPYPTQAEIFKQAADDYLLSSLQPIKPLARFWLSLWRLLH